MQKNGERKNVDLTEWAYNNIKLLILNNTLPAGSQIRIDSMADTLGISRTPIREALIRLASLDLVNVIPHVGCFVNSITTQEFREVFELRCIIECYAAKCAAGTMSDSQIEEWAKYVDRSEIMLQQGNLKEFNECEIKIHDTLIESLNNNRIAQIMSTIADAIYRERSIALTSLDNLKKSMDEHRALADAIISRDSLRAEKAMETHVKNVELRIEKIVFPSHTPAKG